MFNGLKPSLFAEVHLYETQNLHTEVHHQQQITPSLYYTVY